MLVTLMLVWVLAVVTAQLQCVDAARAGARVVSRGESVAASEAAALQAAPDGADVTITRSGDFVTVEVAVDVQPAGGLLEFFPSVRVDGVAHALAEDAIALGGPQRREAASSEAVAADGRAPGYQVGRTGASQQLPHLPPRALASGEA